MEYINRIEIQGKVGHIKTQNMNGLIAARFSVCIETAMQTRSGALCYEIQWFNVTAIEGDDIKGLGKINTGSFVRVIGRGRTLRYTTPEGEDRTMFEVFATEVTLLSE